MRTELGIERDVPHDELVTAIARSLGVDRERIHVAARPHLGGDFALHVDVELPDASDLVVFYRSLASFLACKLLVDDDAHDPHTAMLVTASGETARVMLEPRDDGALVIAGLHHHAYADDEVP